MDTVPGAWDFWVDRGGTFTDVVARRPDGSLVTHKLLSEDPRRYDDAATTAIADLLDVPRDEPLPPDRIRSVKMGTTVATNALLQRRGVPTLFVTTAGFGDVLRIGYQTRPHLFKLDIVLPEMLYAEVLEVSERVAADGTVLCPLNLPAATAAMEAARERGMEAVAIVLVHGYRHTDHEAALAGAAREIGFEQVSVSHEVDPLVKMVPRGDTTVADAYLSPILRSYVDAVASRIGTADGVASRTGSGNAAQCDGSGNAAQCDGGGDAGQCDGPQLQFMQSNGGGDAAQCVGSGNAGQRVGGGDAGQCDGPQLQFMQSNGGLADARRFTGRDALLSGPAGGVVGMARTAQAAGFERLIGFDMGGTSTDVSHFAGEFERANETEVAGIRVRTPIIDMHTVAAGGGSVLAFDGSRLRVGPDSAGADPGPACYGNGGPLAVTDANAVLGVIRPEYFPAMFGTSGTEPLDVDAAAAGIAELAEQIAESSSVRRSTAEVAFGYGEIAAENMANAIRKISTERGHDITAYTLVCFGGAGGQHACRVADRLGITTIFIHPHAGVLSALGIGLADVTDLRAEPVEAPLDEALIEDLHRRLAAARPAAAEAVAAAGVPPERIEVTGRLAVRYRGSDTTLEVPLSTAAMGAASSGTAAMGAASSGTAAMGAASSGTAAMGAASFSTAAEVAAAFAAAHRTRFGFSPPGGANSATALVVDALHIEARGRAADPPPATPPADDRDALLATHTTYMSAGGTHIGDESPRNDPSPHSCAPYETPFWDRTALAPGAVMAGPAVVVEPNATTVIEPGWQGTITDRGDLVLERVVARPSSIAIGTSVDPVQLEIFNNLFMNIAEQMGVVLEHTAVSVNIKERRDFSCALFDLEGRLVANAPHLPVHLGSMSESIRTVITQNPHMSPGDVFVLNNPYNGGTHLPDVTVVRPVFDASGTERIFYVAARGHHADIGGCVPGSAPADSTTIDEEGLVLDNLQIVAEGRFLESEVREVLASGPWPARNPDQNVADLRAQVAACERGATELNRIVEYYGLDVVHAYMGHVADNAEEMVRRVIDALGSNDNFRGSYRAELDDGSVICVRISVDSANRSAVVDFTGTSGQHPGNFNAPVAVCRSAVLYVFRCLVDDAIPLNAGCLRPLELVVPDPSMLSPHPPAAVIAGNVETSQQITDALFGALGVVAASQGTMNNFIWGNDRHQYYETICGGAGATARRRGADAVHTHMTNTRLTDPEILEQRHPVLLERFEVRRGSGGCGANRGGDGVVRRLRFGEAMTANLLSSRRRIAAFGVAGGQDGALGRNLLERADGTVTELEGCARVEVAEDDVIEIHTPGGGGFGSEFAADASERGGYASHCVNR
ncbi:hydantoinase B/oxoprolinase family protein [Candidatus Poriferisodalis sp.]|uniref:hydantoinase B/oxoprolinase family protein n=1 Tax=Candidatus Poriferisodalis sp. TaxID=3101277 RepID=UPI003B51CBA4